MVYLESLSREHYIPGPVTRSREKKAEKERQLIFKVFNNEKVRIKIPQSFFLGLIKKFYCDHLLTRRIFQN
jgi:hypothetical protein